MNENNENNLKYRMYGLVLRSLNGINKGVQFAHSCLEYTEKYYNENDYRKYITYDKTMIMLDGGTHQDMVEIKSVLEDNEINHSYFIEPDLNDCMTAITFLADERVWDKNYDFEFFDSEHWGEDEIFTDWVKSIGGPDNYVLRDILKGKRLSMV